MNKAFFGPVALVVIVTGYMDQALAQHAADNAVATAADAFGAKLGLETIGIYNPCNIRGFCALTAGNERVDGLSFFGQAPLSGRVIDGQRILVGPSEIGSAFPAPTGVVVDQLRAAPDTPTASIIASVGPFQAKGISIDGSLPLAAQKIILPIGASYQISTQSDSGMNPGYTSRIRNVGATPLLRVGESWIVRGIADWQETSALKTLPLIETESDFYPPKVAPGYYGQDWALGEIKATNYGVTVHGSITGDLSISAAAFRSVYDLQRSYADFYLNTHQSGAAEHYVVGNPDQRSSSNSGELQLVDRFGSQAHSQNVMLSLKGRDVTAAYGGSDVVFLGPASIQRRTEVPMPQFNYTVRSSDRTKLVSGGLAYNTSWNGRGTVSIGIQRESYKKDAVTPGSQSSRLSEAAWCSYANAALQIDRKLILYAGFTQGLEDSGVVPNSANNRGEILPASRTRQVDAGIRYDLTSSVNLIAGVFSLQRPYFNFDSSGVDRLLGLQRSRGLELSIAGKLTQNLTVVGGLMQGHVEVLGDGLEALSIGRSAFGQPNTTGAIYADYLISELPKWSVDVGVQHWGITPASINNKVNNPPLTVFAFGVRRRFELWGYPASLRLQVTNAFDHYILNIAYTPGYNEYPPRAFQAYVTMDVR